MRTGLKRYIGRTVVVHQKGPSVRGVLIAAYKDCFVLRHADDLDAQEELGGEVVVPREQGVWMQLPDREAA